VNARRGMYEANGLRLTREAARGRRLMPESIYREATSRDDAIRLLRENGYLTGQAPRRAGRAVAAKVDQAAYTARLNAAEGDLNRHQRKIGQWTRENGAIPDRWSEAQRAEALALGQERTRLMTEVDRLHDANPALAGDTWTRLPRRADADAALSEADARAAWDAAYDEKIALGDAHPEFLDMKPSEIIAAPGGREYLKALAAINSKIDLARTKLNDVMFPWRWAVRGANPGFGDAYRYNCSHVVQAVELRRRGFDVTASALPDAYELAGRSHHLTLSNWRDAEGRTRTFTSTRTSEVEQIVRSWPVGARGWVMVRWADSPSAHIFNVEHTELGVEFLEGQVSGSADDYLRRAEPEVDIVRVDDLVPTDAVLEFIRESPA
jgi:hypothetical protein